jgi:hypothetical protein
VRTAVDVVRIQADRPAQRAAGLGQLALVREIGVEIAVAHRGADDVAVLFEQARHRGPRVHVRRIEHPSRTVISSAPALSSPRTATAADRREVAPRVGEHPLLHGDLAEVQLDRFVVRLDLEGFL